MPDVAPPALRARPGGSLQPYWEASRAPRYSLLFALPLLLLYESLAAMLSGAGSAGVRNGADVLLQVAFEAVAGQYAAVAFAVVVVGTSVILVLRDLRATGRSLQGRIFVFMLAESLALAAIFGLVVGTATSRLVGSLARLTLSPMEQLDWPVRLMVSLGAGLYEELLFRVILVALLAAIARRIFGWRVRAAGIFATLVGATVFSTFHYIGPYGDPFAVQSFVFRLLAGVAFSALYLLRGFGIVAWTHALYDVLLML